MNKPAISVIVCTWNRAATLALSLQSLRAQQGVSPDAVEVIVVDNNSKDDTPAVVDRLQQDWPLGRLRYLFEPRQGKQFALNRGISAASHDVLAFTDDDVDFPPDWLAQVATLFTESKIDLAGGKSLPVWGADGPPPWYLPSMMAVVAGVDLGDERLDPAPDSYAPAGTNLIARRRLIERVGGFSESHYRHMDHEFGVRSQQGGAHVVYAPSLTVNVPVDPHCVTKRYFRHWAFKAGIARDTESNSPHRHLPAVPLWIYRQLAEDALHVATWGWLRPPAEAFSRELRMWRTYGTVASAWHAWLHPAHHTVWIAKHSQKKNNVY
jgi:glycosyltransferase involved in cell wall biosynthesis